MLQTLIQLAIVIFVVAFIANKFKEPLLDIYTAYRKKKKEWDQAEQTKPKV